MTFTSLLDQVASVARRSPRAVAIEDRGRSISYGALMGAVDRVKASLAKADTAPRPTVVALMLENSAEYVAALYGAWAAGICVVPVNANASGRELERVLAHSGAQLIVASRRNAVVAAVCAKMRVALLDLDPSADELRLWDETASQAVGPYPALPETEPSLLLYTSGTTGNPKGVTLTHGNLAANTASIVEYMSPNAEDRLLVVLPFHYSFGNSLLHSHLVVGATLVLGASMLYPQQVTDTLRMQRISGFAGVPTTFAFLLAKSDWMRDPPALRYVAQAGGAMGVSLTRRLLGALPPTASLFVMYGQTEATARLSWLPPAKLPEKIGSVGIAVPRTELAIVDENDRPVGPGVIGEVVARGPHVMRGYWNNPEATAHVLRGGWLHTGDTGYMDPDGFLFLKGRKSDMLKLGAHRVSPEEIEEVEAEVPGVAGVAACGVDDELLGQALHVVVVGEPRRETERAILKHCKTQLAPHKIPRKIHWRDSLPRTASGKLQRYILQSELANSAQREER